MCKNLCEQRSVALVDNLLGMYQKIFKVLIGIFRIVHQGSIKKKSQKVEKVQKGGKGSAPGIKKSTVQNVDFLIRGGRPYFHFFPKCKCKFQICPKFKKVPIILGSRKLWTFSTFCDFFLMLPLDMSDEFLKNVRDRASFFSCFPLNRDNFNQMSCGILQKFAALYN